MDLSGYKIKQNLESSEQLVAVRIVLVVNLIREKMSKYKEAALLSSSINNNNNNNNSNSNRAIATPRPNESNSNIGSTSNSNSMKGAKLDVSTHSINDK